MANWRLKDEEFKQILSRNDDPDNEDESVRAIISELVPHLRTNPCYSQLPKSAIKAISKAKTFHTLNRAIAFVYDYADDNKIWLM